MAKTEFMAKRRFVRMTPDKLRPVASLVRGKKIETALDKVRFLPKAAARPVYLTLKNALSQAKEKDQIEENLTVSRVFVDEGPKLKRRRIIHQGRATAILKRMSHLTIVLTSEENNKNDTKFEKNTKNTKAKKK